MRCEGRLFVNYYETCKQYFVKHAVCNKEFDCNQSAIKCGIIKSKMTGGPPGVRSDKSVLIDI